MSDVKWIKITTNMFDDEKIKLIRKLPDADSILLTWIQLLTQAGKANASGSIVLSEKIPYSDEMLSIIFDRPLSVIRLALQTFHQFGMIDMEDGIISIANGECFMINRVMLFGRLTRDPELRYTPSGVANCTFSLAVDSQFKNAQGEKEADFINVVAWRQTAELAAQYLKKGSQTGVDGRLQTRSYDNKEGKRIFVTEVVAENIQFLSPSNSENRQPSQDPFKNEKNY